MKTAHFYSDAQKELLKIREDTERHRNTLENQVQHLRMSASETGGVLFSKQEAIEFLRILPQMINQTGNALVSMSPGEMQSLLLVEGVLQKPKKESIDTESGISCIFMPVQVTIRGNYIEVTDFFEQLEGHDRMLTISEIYLENTAENPASVDARIILNLYICERDEGIA